MPSPERPRAKHGDDNDDDNDDYFDLAGLARYSKLSVRTLHRYLKDPVHPLPHHQVCAPGKTRGRVLVAKRAFDRWMGHFAVGPDAGPPAPDVAWIRRLFDK